MLNADVLIKLIPMQPYAATTYLVCQALGFSCVKEPWEIGKRNRKPSTVPEFDRYGICIKRN